jgi:hypothetical protein
VIDRSLSHLEDLTGPMPELRQALSGDQSRTGERTIVTRRAGTRMVWADRPMAYTAFPERRREFTIPSSFTGR